jgi:acetolactate synthase-1/2/3 large subunit
MKLSDYVIDQIHSKGSRHVFGMSGGSAVHLFDSAARHPDVSTTFVAHEQSAAMAADGYSRISGNLGTCVVTSGPGATNLLTGVCCSYYDSVPTLILTGQVATHRLKGERNVRQVGFQETDTLSIFSSVTKYAEQLLDPTRIGYLLDRAYFEATSNRPGPVLVDIPDDLQRVQVDPAAMKRFSNIKEPLSLDLLSRIEDLLSRLSLAKRPVIVLGGGLNTPRQSRELREFLRQVEVPILQTWAAIDLVPFEQNLRVGTFGVYGPRLGNFVIQNADLLICLGTRLSQNLTGGVLNGFAPNALIIMVDVDSGEMDKFDGRGICVAKRINCRTEDFLETANIAIGNFQKPNIGHWLSIIQNWRQQLPNDIPHPPADNAGFVDVHHLVIELSKVLATDEIVFVDTGGNLTWTCNNLRVKMDQRVISAWNFTPMGYSIPAGIGGAAAAPGRSITCIIGDGGMQLCLGELATIVRYNLPLKIILFNNHAHGIQRQTIETWLESNFVGVDHASGLGLSDFPRVASAMGLPVVTISRSSEIAQRLTEVYAISGPVFCNVEISPDQKLYPVAKFGASLDNQMPLLSKEKFEELRLR